jgi:outer membrane cobalamin receptor
LNPNNNKAKLTVEPQAYFMLYQGEAVNDTANISIFDLGFEANYYYSSVLRIFANVNNILGLDNDRYLNYPTQRVNFLIGLSYSFGGHKE